MALSDLQKGALSKLFTLAGFGLLGTFAAFILAPVTSEHAAFDGVCNITAFYWVDDSCMRDSNFYFTYRVPIIEGYVVRLDGQPSVLPGSRFLSSDNFTVEKYESLFVNKSYQRGTGYSTTDKYKSILFDDYSEHTLINCSYVETVALKRALVQYIPTLKGALDIESTVDHTLKYYPDTYFNCTFLHKPGNEHEASRNLAFINFQWSEKWPTVFVAVAVLIILGGLALIIKYDRDSIPKSFAYFIFGFIYWVLTVINIPFFFIIRVVIGECFLSIPAGDPEDFLKSGSIFFPLVWLIKRCCVTRCTSESPPASPRATPSDSPADPSAATSRRQSHRTRRSVTPAASIPSEPNLPRSGSMPHVSVSETFPSAPPEPNSRPHAPPISSEKPPSYPAIYTEGTVLPNPVVLQYHLGDREDFDSETLPPPPSYDDAVNNQ